MFPLGSVVFPHTPVPLHVFEPRYRALARDCTRGNGHFGIVLISRGSEVGGGDERFSVGTVVRIAESIEYPDGRWDILAVGDRRIRVATWLPDDPYPVALVQDLVEHPLDEGGGLLEQAEREVRRALSLKSELGEPSVPPTFAFDPDPSRAAYQLAAVAPIGSLDKQRLLELESPAARLQELTRLTAEAAELLAYRLGGR